MRTLALALLLAAGSAHALDIRAPSPNGTAITPNSVTVTGASGLNTTYGVVAGSGTFATACVGPACIQVAQRFNLQGACLLDSDSQTLFGDNGLCGGGAADGNTLLQYFNGKDLIIKETGTERLRVKGGGNVGIGTTSPATTLDVNGSAQFGSGATKSTFTASGFLTITGSTLTVASSGIISAPSQPGIRAYLGIGGQNIANNVITPIYMSNTSFAQGGMFLNAASSGTFVVPPGGAGVYQVNCSAGDFAVNATGIRVLYIYKNAVLLNAANQAGSTQVAADLAVSTAINAVAGDAFSCQVYQNSGGSLTIGADNNGYSGISVIKVW